MISKRRRTCRVCLCLLVVLLLASTAAAQEFQLTDRTEVRAVHLDVLVVGRDGEPVTDLTRQDFAVEEDGQPVAIDFFDSPALPGEGDLVAVEEAPPEPAGPIEWIVFVDDLRLDGAARKRVLQDLETTLQRWQDEGGTPGGARLRLIIQRETDRLEEGPFERPLDLLEVLRARPKAAVTGVMARIARRRAFDRLAGIREACALSGRDLCNDCWGELLAEATQHAVTEVQRVEQSSIHLSDLLTRLDASEGRRGVLYVGDGMPMLAGASVLWSLAEQCTQRRSEIEGEVAVYSQRRTLEQLAALANAQRTALHLLDAGGLRESFSSNDSEHNRNLQAGLQVLAEKTGGRAVLNANRTIEPVAESMREEQARYELGFTLSRSPTGRVHSVQVSLVGDAAKGRTVRYRDTYWDRTSDMRLQQRMLSAVEPMRAVDRPAGASSLTGLRLELVSNEKVDRRSRKVDLRIVVDGERVAVLPTGDGRRQGRITLGLLSAEPQGRPEPKVQQINLGDEGLRPGEAGDYELVVGLVVPTGLRVFVVGVRDEVTGEVLVQRLEAKI